MKVTLDKLVHFLASGWLFFIILTLTSSLPLAVFGALGIGVVKEIYDEFIKGTGFNLIDIFYNIAGVFVSVVLVLIKSEILK